MKAIESNTPAEPQASRVIEPRTVRLAEALGVREAGRVLRDFATYLPTQAIPAIAGFLALPILARKLSQLELGVLTISQTLIILGWTVIGGWLAAAIIREYPVYSAKGDIRAFARTLIQALLLTFFAVEGFAAIVFLGGFFSSAIAKNLFFIIGATAGLVVQNIAVSLFAASLRPRAYALVEMTARVGGVVLGVILVFRGHGVSGYLLGLACSSAVIGVVGLAAAWPRTKRLDSDPSLVDVPSWLRYGVPVAAGSIALWALAFIDRYILAALKDASDVGVYAVGSIIGDRIVMIPMFAFFAAASPLLMTAFERHGRREVERLMRAYTRIILLIGIACVAFIAAIARVLVELLTGSRNYGPAATVAPIVAFGSLLFAVASVGAVGLGVAKHTRPLFYSSSIGLAANVLANLILIPPFGIDGAAVATPIGTGVYLVAVHLWVRPHATWRFPYLTLARCAIAGGVGYAVAVAAMQATASRPKEIALAAAAGGVAYIGALALLGERRGFERPAAA